jgi:putative transposase
MRWLGTLLCLGMTYPSSLSDTEWDHLQCYMPPIQTRGRPRSHSLRAVLDAIFYLLRTGCPWRYLPRDFPPWQTVYYHFCRFRLSGMWHRILTALRAAERQRMGRDAQPTAAIIDAQSMKTVEESAPISGYYGHKNVKGRKRHLLVDNLGLPLSVYVTPADVQDRAGTRCLLAGLKLLVPRLKKIWADRAYSGEELARWCEEEGGWELEVVEQNRGAQGFKVLPRRWIVERTFSWLVRNRRLSKDYERMAQSSETFIKAAMIRLIVRRLARGA